MKKIDAKVVLQLKKVFAACILFLCCINANAQNSFEIKGVVTDDKGVPLSAASVVLKGTKLGTVTNTGGSYSFVINNKGTLVFSYAGFDSKEISVTQSQTLNVSLAANNAALNDVVVTGYSRQSKRDVTGAASTVSADVIAQTPVSDIGTALQGRVPGVSVDDQGGPGGSATIRIRGIGSLGNNDPLYVIDGVQVRIGNSDGSQDISNLINPSDIENITVLKDPSLTGLYGSEGSNGVIVITTKTGKLGQPKLEYSAYVADQYPRKFPDMITPQQQADALYQSYVNTNQTFPFTSFYGNGTTPVLPDYIIEGPNQNIGVMAGDPKADPSLYNFSNYRILKANKSGTDWWGALFKPALSQNHQLALSGATDKSNYAVTFNYNSDNGIYINSYFKRLSLRANTEFKVKPWLRIGENFDFSYTTGSSIGRGFNNDISALYSLPGLLPEYDIAGNFSGLRGATVLGGVGNPLIERDKTKYQKSYTEGIIGSAFIEVGPIKGISFQTQIGAQLVPNQYHFLSDSVIQNPIPITQTYFYEGSSYYTDWRWLNKLSFAKTINGIHKISAFVAYEARQYKSRYISVTVDSLISTQPNFQYLNAGFANPNFPPQGSGDIQTSISEFGNITYSLMDRYLLSATLRHDGSSKFGVNSQFGTFPSGSVGWRISDEKFMDNITWINDLKLRGSWGKAGNDAIGSGAQYSLINANDFIFGGYDLGGTNLSQVLGAYPSQTGNPFIHWETNVTTNIGLDATFLHNKLTASLDWFNRKTEDLLYQPPYTGTAGAAYRPTQNIMSFTNKGVEAQIGFSGGNKKSLSFDMNFNISSYRSNVDFINGDSSTHIDLGGFAPTHYNLTRNEVGHSVSLFYGYVFAGIYQSKEDIQNSATFSGVDSSNGVGHFKFKDISGPNGKPDGIINDKDQTFLGNPSPKFSFGYSLNLYYKNFDLGIFVQGTVGNKIFNYWRSFSEWPGDLTVGSLDTWTPTNTDAKLPIYTNNNINNLDDNVPSSFFIENGSYLRIKTLQLGYTFSKMKAINKLRIYVQAYNILTITGYSGLDPEVNNGDPGSLGIDYGTQYPMSQKILFGVNLGL